MRRQIDVRELDDGTWQATEMEGVVILGVAFPLVGSGATLVEALEALEAADWEGGR